MDRPRHRAPRGTSDFLFEDLALRQAVAQRILAVLAAYGFRQIQTPAIEDFEVLATQAGDELQDQIYALVDRSGRRLGLKSDNTAAVARVVAAKAPSWPKPIRIAVHDRVYRYERPQEGRMREFTHLNAELFGSRGALADAELVACFVDCYRAVGLRDFTIRISDRRLLHRLLASWDLASGRRGAVIRALDKRRKLARPAWTEEVLGAGLPPSRLAELERLLNAGGDVGDSRPARACLGEVTQVAGILDDLDRLGERLAMLGVAPACRFDFSIARGLEYYTGLIFECFHAATASGRDYGAIGGGGRYDRLVETYGGPPLAATGFAIGFERVMLLLADLGLLDRFRASAPLLYVGYDDDRCLPAACAVAQELRGAGLATHLAHAPAAVKKLLRKAAAVAASHLILVRPGELEAETVAIKDLRTRRQRTVPRHQLLAALDQR